MVYIPANSLICNAITDGTENNIVQQKNRDVLILPAGNLSTTVLRLINKAVQEKKYYSFDLKNRMLSGDTISQVKMYANEETVIGEKLTYEDQNFTILITGGESISDVGINFVINTTQGEILEFVCVLPIRPEGVLDTGEYYNAVLGSIGPSGTGLPEGSLIHDGMIISPDQIGVLPSDLILNGNLYTAPGAYLDGTKQLPSGLFLNSNIVMTDGSVFFPHTINNNGVLCAA